MTTRAERIEAAAREVVNSGARSRRLKGLLASLRAALAPAAPEPEKGGEPVPDTLKRTFEFVRSTFEAVGGEMPSHEQMVTAAKKINSALGNTWRDPAPAPSGAPPADQGEREEICTTFNMPVSKCPCWKGTHAEPPAGEGEARPPQLNLINKIWDLFVRHFREKLGSLELQQQLQALLASEREGLERERDEAIKRVEEQRGEWRADVRNAGHFFIATEWKARVEALEQSMKDHFQRDHLEGDGPEIDRWKRKVEALERELREALEHGDRLSARFATLERERAAHQEEGRVMRLIAARPCEEIASGLGCDERMGPGMGWNEDTDWCPTCLARAALQQADKVGK